MWASGDNLLEVPGQFLDAFVDELSRCLEATVRSSDVLRQRIIIEAVTSEDERSSSAVVLLRDTSRPGCLFATKCSPEPLRVALELDRADVALAASVCAANIEEQIAASGHGLPPCAFGETVWF